MEIGFFFIVKRNTFFYYLLIFCNIVDDNDHVTRKTFHDLQYSNLFIRIL